MHINTGLVGYLPDAIRTDTHVVTGVIRFIGFDRHHPFVLMAWFRLSVVCRRNPSVRSIHAEGAGAEHSEAVVTGHRLRRRAETPRVGVIVFHSALSNFDDVLCRISLVQDDPREA